MDVQNLVREARTRTGITREALARKLGVDCRTLDSWEADPDELPEAVYSALQEFVGRTEKGQAASGPRIKAPDVATGIVCADSIEYMATLSANSVDMILSDIPYGIGLDDWDVLHDNTNAAYMGKSAAQDRAGKVFKRRRKPINGWSEADRDIPRQYGEWCATWGSEWLRVLKPGGSAVVFAGRRFSPRCVVALEDAGFCFRDMLGWIRRRAVLRAQRLSIVFEKRGELAEAKKWSGWRVGNLRPLFEPIIWCFKPYKLTLADNVLDHGVGPFNLKRFEEASGSSANFIEADFAPGESGKHEAQKPLALMGALIELCTQPGHVILDPFAGSGSTAVAACTLDRRFLAIERQANFCEIARERVASVRDQARRTTLRLDLDDV